MQNVLLIDDDIELLDMLSEYLRREGFNPSLAASGEEGLALLKNNHYAIIILDIMMSGMDGLETLKKIRELSLIPILMLTARGDDSDRIIGLELGADDYVPKPCTPRELTARIKAILRRSHNTQSPQENNRVITINDCQLWPGKRQAFWSNTELLLTSSEFNLLEVLIKNAGKLVTKTQLSEEGLGHPLARFERSIDVHISRIRNKIELINASKNPIKTVHGQGYIFIIE
ncbi:MAG: DNA-binding response regulator [Ferrovum sp. 37-45-19]|uniref:response regulator transcription factor n=1 Tax=Ferrovum sp. JA12 TaxID=1356299 RepID=UPI000702A61A|nr:response regulator transcription factor [Ferrovum sp. JA12]OYV78771.1 MAG: DNA-binding response regulator [Ferrovum sp. 21-44-67]OYV93923.1 MAG: DNA-binding response regulator [Ferrovum sp. 37-45-19]OZB32009.1 MAG: DNA-binding response regulator [Ferrovum sp. 34-44-207]HQT81980.1 response regulator transcription factor [Ferrovaceae bacterium]KRH78963.1 transcriptional regulatory protein CpxR [Ferrovum sp. JA12]